MWPLQKGHGLYTHLARQPPKHMSAVPLMSDYRQLWLVQCACLGFYAMLYAVGRDQALHRSLTTAQIYAKSLTVTASGCATADQQGEV